MNTEEKKENTEFEKNSTDHNPNDNVDRNDQSSPNLSENNEV